MHNFVMAYLYHFELILVGIILLSTMTFAGVRMWLKRKRESLEENFLEGEDTKNSEL